MTAENFSGIYSYSVNWYELYGLKIYDLTLISKPTDHQFKKGNRDTVQIPRKSKRKVPQ